MSDESTVNITSGIFKDNNVCHDRIDGFSNGPECYGGAVLFDGMGVSVTIENSQFTQNKALYGGAIYTYCPKKLTISETQFSDNEANFDAGALYVVMYNPNNDDFEIKLTNANFTSNYAERGGALHLTSSRNTTTKHKVPEMKNISFIKNK